MQVMEWPPAYKIKRHARARHVRMVYSRSSGLEITVPKRFSTKHIPSILEENKDWIIQQKIKHDHPEANTRPVEIYFLAIQKRWQIHYFQSVRRPRIKQFSMNDIILSGDIHDFEICREKLRLWVRKQAQIILTAYFHKLASEIKIPYSDVTVRSQTTLWGSCSEDKTIRLNYKLIFLPEELMRHIMIHELCHTIHMDHSEQFWQMVARFDHQWKEHKKAMRKADSFMPAWI